MIDQDNLHMKFLALNVDFQLSFDPISSRGHLYGASNLGGNWNFHSHSQERKFYRWNFCSQELSFPGAFIPWNFRSLELLLPRAKMTWNFCSGKGKWHGTFAPLVQKLLLPPTAHMVHSDHKTSFPVDDLLKLVGLHV